MRSPLVSLFCAQMGFSKAFPNTANTGSLEPKREETSNAPTVPSIQNLPSLKDRQDEPAKNKSYRVLVTDTFNDAQINKTREWLDSISDEASRMIEIEVFPWEKPDGVDEDELQKWIQDGEVKPDVLDNMKVDGWFRVLLDEAGFKLVSDKKEWVRSITEVRAPVDLSPVPNPKPRESENLQRRKFEWGEWERQPDADPDLVQDSAFEGGDFSSMKDYVYEKRSGQDILMYVIDEGFNVDVKNENGELLFPAFSDPDDNSGIVQTRAFRDQNPPDNNPRVDHNANNPGHGTIVASKILGHHGAAKNSILVPVTVLPGDNSDLIAAFTEISRDFMGRRRDKPDVKAVIIMSRGISLDHDTRGFTRDEAEQDDDGKAFLSRFRTVFIFGIPVVLASGNAGQMPNRAVIDYIPQVLEKDDVPIINVGAATIDGKALPQTQGQGTQDGTQLTIYGVGQNVVCHDHIDGKPTMRDGTSVAAPVVAAIIGQHMIYEPWDTSKTGKDRVQEIKNFIRGPESSWERNKQPNPDNPDMKVNMIWNGADKASHESVQPQDDPPEPDDDAPTGPTKALSIVTDFASARRKRGLFTLHWLFFQTDFGYAIDCRTDTAANYDIDYDDSEDGPHYPEGNIKMTLFDEDCEYQPGDRNPGKLVCNGKDIECQDDNADAREDKGNHKCGSLTRQPVFTCSW